MLRRWIRDLKVDLHWLKIYIFRQRNLDTPVGIVGIITVISGVFLLIMIGDAITHVFRAAMPWVSGSQLGEVYWLSIGIGIKISFFFLLFTVSLILFILLKLSDHS